MTSKNRTEVRAARAARLFLLIQPIRTLVFGVVLAVVLSRAPMLLDFLGFSASLRFARLVSMTPHYYATYYDHSMFFLIFVFNYSGFIFVLLLISALTCYILVPWMHFDRQGAPLM